MSIQPFPSTLLIRNTKHKPKIGQPLAVNYRNNVMDPTTHLEAMIEAYGALNVLEFVRTIDQRRRAEMRRAPENFRMVTV